MHHLDVWKLPKEEITDSGQQTYMARESIYRVFEHVPAGEDTVSCAVVELGATLEAGGSLSVIASAHGRQSRGRAWP